ncbi:beta-N-acetylhexosaminidase [Snuella lapsa]|uniref:beta-N-acetylhexosaminidase n=2 Tax=Snuella lapsa TaxID=870481 RepID=A0ABP6WQX9_9FLAO
MQVNATDSYFTFKKKLNIAYDVGGSESAQYLSKRLENYLKVRTVNSDKGDILLSITKEENQLGDEGYNLSVSDNIRITANTETGLFYGIQSLLQLLPVAVQARQDFKLVGVVVKGTEVIDRPKYKWRSFMLDSGRQFQSPEFIKNYLDYMAMLKMNVFHWHLTEGQGWRIEIKQYPKLTEIGSKVAKGKEQQGYYTQAVIRDIVAYAKALHIDVVPEIDVPGHSEAALCAYPELSCFNEAPKSVMAFSPNLFCGGKESTYTFLKNVLDEVCDLFPSKYIHLGGDEAPKGNWNKCPHCKQKIEQEGLGNAHNLQLYFSSQLASYLKTKSKNVVFWGDVVYHDGVALPDNVVIQWWNWRGYKDKALQEAIKRGHPVICNTNYYTYLNFPLTPWSKYQENRTFDMRKLYEENPSDVSNPHDLILGMGCSLWTDWFVQEYMADRRVFPRIYALAEQMWHKGDRLSFDVFYSKVKNMYPVLKGLGIDYGPALMEEVPDNYRWE